MPNHLIDLTSQTFGELTVIQRADHNTNNGKPLWLCKCSCGNTKIIPGSSLRRGQSKSCGCCKSHASPLYVRTHENRLYHTWSELRRRCHGRTTNYQYYSGKGISYCKEWENFDAFAEWAIQNGYNPELEIDRIDGNGDYSPDNCRWVSHKDNSRNRKARSNNSTGIAGIHTRTNKYGISYRATITTDTGRIHIGTFKTLEEAAAARRDAEKKYWGFVIGENDR